MSLNVQTNLQSLIAQRHLDNATRLNENSMEKISSGFRINKSADDAAGFAISTKLQSDIRGLNMAKRNANDGVSLIQTAEGGMNEVSNILTRLRELAVQGSSDTIGDKERGYIQKEFNAMKDEVDRITNSTEFNGVKLLAGEKGGMKGPLEIQVGKNWSVETDSKGAGKGFDRNPINVIRLGFDKINTSTEGLGLGRASDNSMESTGVFMEGASAGESKKRAQMSIAKIDEAISRVSDYRAEMGAMQNRLGSTISNLSVQGESYTAANSRIRDTDFADESAKLTQSNILKQGGISVLAQANQIPSAALKLLG